MYHVSAQGVDERMINVHYYIIIIFRIIMFFVVQSNDSFNFPLGLIKYIVIVVVVIVLNWMTSCVGLKRILICSILVDALFVVRTPHRTGTFADGTHKRTPWS